MGKIRIRLAGREDLAQLARLLWRHAAPEEQARQPEELFAADLGSWWADHGASHHAFVAHPAGSGDLVGMAWLALVPRVPRPGVRTRRSADIQSVFVLPDHRGTGIGSALVQAAAEHAMRLEAGRVTVQSGRKAVAMYERIGFASSRQLLQWPSPDASSGGRSRAAR